MENYTHIKEIENSRVGGLGGSDAALVLRAANGVESLNNTDLRRLAVMLGLRPYQPIPQNEAMAAGHDFEDYVEQHAADIFCGLAETSDTYTREEKMTANLVPGFSTFAHADFILNGSHVVECKYSQRTTDEVIKTYQAQLQWYYMLGASRVTLCHGTGQVPFTPEGVALVMVTIERNESIIERLKRGLINIMDALAEGWQPKPVDSINYNDVPEAVQLAFATLRRNKETRAEIDAQDEAAKALIMDFCADFAVSSISDGRHSASVSAECITRSFDKARLFKKHPEFDVPEYYKESRRKASVMFK